MVSDIDRLMGHVRGVWHRRWIVLALATAISFAGWGMVVFVPDRYAVSAKVYLDTQSMLGPLLKGLAADSNVTEKTALVLRRTLLSRPFLEKVVRDTDMDLLTQTPEEYEYLLIKLASELSISKDRKEPIYTIKYENKDPQLAKKVVESLLTLFVEGALGASRKDTTSTERFLDEQIQDYETKLSFAENALKEFKQKNAGVMPNQGRNYFGQLAAASEAVRIAQLELAESVNRKNELERQLREVGSSLSTATGSGQGSTPIDMRIRAAQERLDGLLVQFTDEHPDIVSTRRILESLEAKKAKQASSDHASQLVSNPVYQALKVSLGESEANVAALTVRVEQSKLRVERLRLLVNTMPEVEAGLARLNRDYDVIHRNYKELVQRREAARLSQKAELNADDVQFTVLDPPRVPLVPVSPNRPLLYTLVLLLGLGAGAGIVWITIQLKPTFDSAAQLIESLELPVYGSVMLVLSPQQKKRRRRQMLSFALGSSVLLGVFLTLQIVNVMGINMQSVLSGTFHG